MWSIAFIVVALFSTSISSLDEIDRSYIENGFNLNVDQKEIDSAEHEFLVC